jgi:hypothetical protein
MSIELTNKEKELLLAAANAARNNTIIYADASATALLVAQGLLEGNPAFVDPANGNIAFRPTAAGMTLANQLSVPAETLDQRAFRIAASHPGFQRVTGFLAPQKSRRKVPLGSRKYDFDTLELNEGLFIPATEEMPNPKKSLASSVSSANRKYAEFNPPRYFRTYRAEAGQVFGDVTAPADGVYVVRTDAPPPPKPVVLPAVSVPTV